MKITIEITPEEFKELVGESNTGTLKGMSLKEAARKMQEDKINVLPIFYSPRINPLMLESGPSVIGTWKIKADDRCRIAPAENCVTNADKIKYDEQIDGKIVVVKRIEKDSILVQQQENRILIFVEPSWLIKL